MKVSRPSLVATVAGLFVACVLQAAAMQVPTLKVYESTGCIGKPVTLAFFPDEQCSSYNLDKCYSDGNHGYTVSCANSYKVFTDTIFGSSPYLFAELYADGTSCGTFKNALVYSLDGKCHAIGDADIGTQVTLNSDNSVTFVQAADTSCTQMDSSTTDIITSDMINTNVCVESTMKLYSNVGASSTTSSTTTTVSTGDASDAQSHRVATIATTLVAVAAQVVLGL